ncbi:MAG TPA: PQQ-binding-like beta-propeller repeat protein [Candidatus Solibacter sp.]|nr:PQQ-binding-like beta-propeller repeat protein [Candidatus Solibacter sp.]
MAKSLIYIGICGDVLAIDRATGEEVWRQTLKGADFVNVAVVDRDVIGTTKGELFCLDAATGEIRWHNKLPGLGTGLITIAAPGAQQTVVMHEKRQRDAQAAAAAAAAAG